MRIAPGHIAMLERTWDSLPPTTKEDFVDGIKGRSLRAMPVSAFPELPCFRLDASTYEEAAVEPVEFRLSIEHGPNGTVRRVTSGSVQVYREYRERKRSR